MLGASVVPFRCFVAFHLRHPVFKVLMALFACVFLCCCHAACHFPALACRLRFGNSPYHVTCAVFADVACAVRRTCLALHPTFHLQLVPSRVEKSSRLRTAIHYATHPASENPAAYSHPRINQSLVPSTNRPAPDSSDTNPRAAFPASPH